MPTLPPAPAVTILFFDDFDDENNGTGVNNWTGFQQWNVLEGCVDLHGNGFYDVQRGHGLYVDLDGSCNAGGTIETKESFEFAPGTYILEFWLAGNQRRDEADTVVVTLGDIHQEQIVLDRGESFRLFSRTVTVTSSTQAALRFRNLGGDNQGALLDVIRIRRPS